MTTLRFYRSHGRLSGFTCQGHSGYAEAGEDIVCAAITSAIRLLECTLNDVMKAGADCSVDERGTRITLKLSSPSKTEEELLKGFFLYMQGLKNEYPDYITVLEV